MNALVKPSIIILIHKRYREWCWNNGLYLNPLTDLQADDINRYDDNLLLPSLLFQSDKDLNKYISMFNQITRICLCALSLF